MAKILISFLGTGPISLSNNSKREYRKAAYSIDGIGVGESSFVASILYDHFKFDGLYLIGTSKSMWEEVYLYFSEKKSVDIDDEAYFNLANIVASANHLTNSETIDLSVIDNLLGPKSKTLCIPYGLNREEQIQIFSKLGKLFKSLEPNDEVILDVTHSFRSLPLFATSVINYFRSLSKEIKFEKVYYGMLDAMSEFDNIAPIIDISTTIEMQNWTTAAYSFKEYGKGKLLSDLLDGDDGKIVKTFSDAVNINYLNEIKTKLVNFKKKSDVGFDNAFANWVVPEVLELFTSRLYKSIKRQSFFQFELSLWHTEKENYSSAYIVLVESIITFGCEQKKVNWKEKASRDNIRDKIMKENLLGLKDIYTNTNKRRKNIAHNVQGRQNLVKEDIEYLKEAQKTFKSILNNANHG